MTDHPNVRRFLDLSTGHLTPATRNLLDSTGIDAWPVVGGRMPYGYFIYAHDEDCGEDPMPADLWSACVMARSLGCEYLLFDADAEEVEGLATYGD